jgi:hypothetical protein
MRKKYPASQTISLLFKLISLALLIAAVLHILLIILSTGHAVTYRINYLSTLWSTLPFALLPFFSLLFLALILWAFSELLVCLVDIEYNTRRIAQNPDNPSRAIPNDVPSLPTRSTQIAQYPAPQPGFAAETAPNQATSLSREPDLRWTL